MKKINKISIISTVLLSMTSIQISAVSINWDEIYKNAYNSMKEVEAKKTQQGINEARMYIKELCKNDNLITMASTLSSKVDSVQESLFKQFYNLMYVNGKIKTRMYQEEINKAREYVNDFSTYEGNRQYTKSWSTAIDEFQQKNINETIEAIQVVEKSKAIEDFKPAKKLLDELETSTNEDTKNLTKILDKRMTIVEKEIIKQVELKKEKQLETKIKEEIKDMEKEINNKIDQFKREEEQVINKKIDETKEQLNKKVDEYKKVIGKESGEIKKMIKQLQSSETKEQLLKTLEKMNTDGNNGLSNILKLIN